MGAPQADGLGNAKASEPHSGLGPTGAIPSAVTRGPWAAERVDYEAYGLDASYEVVCGARVIVQTHMREIKSESRWLAEDEANVRLIAAAPELYAELERAVRFLRSAPLESGVCCCGNPIEGHGYSDGHSPVDELQYHSSGLVESLEAALAKARGGA